ncbi:MAG: response regulator [Bacilli bacterium]
MEETLTILVADDNVYMADLIAITIKNDTRFKVIGVAKDGKEEIELIKKLKPSIVISDLKKGTTWCGLDIIKELQKSSEEMPIFFIISASTYNYYTEIRELNIRYFLNKPCDNERILEMLDRIYDDVYPKKIMNLSQNREIETDNRNFFNKLLNKLKKRMS